MTMIEYENNFFGLLKYVGFIKDEKVKIHRLLSGLPSFYKENIHYYEPRNLTETIRKDKYMYEKGKGRESMHKSWKDNVSNNFCLGHKSTQVCRLHGKRPSAEWENLFSGHKSSERAKFCCQQPRSTYKADRRSSGFRGCQAARDLAQG
jgi:hypothetical protein